MGHAPGHNCSGCTSPEVQALFCELMDNSTTPERAAEIRAHIARCDRCQERLECEDAVRRMVSKCCGGVQAPEALRRRISISITRTEIRYRP